MSKRDVNAMGKCGERADSGNCLLNDMVFDIENPRRRFVAGSAGVFLTSDAGANWRRRLDTRARLAQAMWFDPISRPKDTALYVANWGRGILKLHPIPDD
jgi:hypothetical protein